ncbi:uncharacterized protein [Rutidosis leptorrhynchoides]|uniref:uncharacterized protein isoform X4 n=1 Tax=Rutidosis leptorrhynchoides TaxID=125765 RepID=UPI003A9A5222
MKLQLMLLVFVIREVSRSLEVIILWLPTIAAEVARVFHMKVKEFVSLLKEEPLIITKLGQGSRGRRFFLPELPKL